MDSVEQMSIGEILSLPRRDNVLENSSYDIIEIVHTDRLHEDSEFPVVIIVGCSNDKCELISSECDVLIFDGNQINVEFLKPHKGLRCWRRGENDKLVIDGFRSTIRIL